MLPVGFYNDDESLVTGDTRIKGGSYFGYRINIPRSAEVASKPQDGVLTSASIALAVGNGVGALTEGINDDRNHAC